MFVVLSLYQMSWFVGFTFMFSLQGTNECLLAIETNNNLLNFKHSILYKSSTTKVIYVIAIFINNADFRIHRTYLSI